MLAAKTLQRVGQRTHGQRGNHEHPEFGFFRFSQRARQTPHRFQLRHQALNFRIEHLSLTRWHQAIALPCEQRETELGLCMLQGLCDGGLCHMQQTRGRTDAAGQHDGVEYL